MTLDNIKIITYGNFPFGGASANFLRNLAIGLTQHGGKVEVLLPKGNYFGEKIENVQNRIGRINNVSYRFLCFPRHPRLYVGKLIDNFCGPFLLFIYIIFNHLFIEKIHYIIKYNVTFSSQFLLLILSKSLGIKLIGILPEFYEKPQTGILSRLKWKNFHFGIKYLAKHSSGLIVLTQYLKNYIIRQNSKIPILIQPNIVNPESFQIQVKKKDTDNVLIGYSGTPTKKDGILNLLESFELVTRMDKNVRLLIIGDITNGKSVIPDLKKYCNKLNIADKVEFTGLVPFNYIPKLLNSCDILVLARPRGIFAEAGFPTKLGEYFACKKPVVVTDVGDINYYFKNTNTLILVKANNSESISEGILRLLKDTVMRKEIGENGYSWMKKNLDYIQVSKKIQQFLHDIA